MKPLIPKRTRRLRARAATMNSRADEYEDHDPEPNMKLSHAFIVVLLLHVVAVGGLYTFNSIKHSKPTLTKAERSGDPVTPPTGPSNDQGGANAGGGGDEPPASVKPPVAAKTGEVKAESHAKNGFLSGAKNLISKTVGASGVVGAGKAVAQQSAPVQSETAPPATARAVSPAVTPSSYMVKAGDTLTRIASALGVSIPDLEKINGMTEKSVIQVGQILKVPVKVAAPANAQQIQTGKLAGGGQQVTSAPGSANPAASVADGGPSPAKDQIAPADQPIVSEYVVVKGDNPWKIAKKFKISQDELMKANGISDPKKIQIGQNLKIPAPASSKKAAQ
jgi:LysM repeat protein